MKKVLAFILLGGCGYAGPSLPPPSDDTCNAADYAALIGQPATALERVLLMGKVRVIRPNQPVTMDFWADRINFLIGDDDSITAINCG